MKGALCLLVSLLVLNAAFAAKDKKPSAVVTLGSDNFDQLINDNQFVLVEFYAPWCGHCKALAPHYEKAAVALQQNDPPVVLAKVDVTEEEELGQRFEIEGFPTLKFFKSGVPLEYSGGRTDEAIVSWVVKRLGPAAKTLATKDEVEEFKTSNKVAVVGFFADATSDEYKTFEKVALSNDDIAFGVVTDAGVAAALGASAPSVLLFKQFDDPKLVFSGDISSADALSEWVGQSSLPVVVEFNESSAPKIFGGAVKVQVLLFGDSSSDSFKAIVDGAYRAVAGKYKGKAIFVTISKDEDRIMEYFGLDEGSLPALRLVQLTERDLNKFVFEESEMSEANLEAFVQSFFDGKLARHLKSEPIPESQEGFVKVLVGKNFDDVVMKSSKNVLVEFYAPWCGHCKQLEPIYNELAESLKGYSDIVIAKMDATANEVESVSVQGFPTIKLYKNGAKEEPIDYDGDRTVAAFTEWLKEQNVLGQEQNVHDDL